MINLRFNRLVVLSLIGSNKYRQRIWLCECDCGNQSQVTTLDLNSGNTQSCGCLLREKASARASEVFRKHGLSHSRLYQIRQHMIDRCYNPDNPAWKWYGLKGVTVCDTWLNDVTAFVDWALANGYRDDLTIDRIDSSGNYEPGNCRWATYNEQARNRSSTILTEDDVRAIRNDSRDPRSIAEVYGIAKSTVLNIKNRHTWKDVW